MRGYENQRGTSNSSCVYTTHSGRGLRRRHSKHSVSFPTGECLEEPQSPPQLLTHLSNGGWWGKSFRSQARGRVTSLVACLQ